MKDKKDKDKDKHKDKDKDHHRDRDRDRHRDKDKDKARDKDRDKDREKARDKERAKDKDQERSSPKAHHKVTDPKPSVDQDKPGDIGNDKQVDGSSSAAPAPAVKANPAASSLAKNVILIDSDDEAAQPKPKGKSKRRRSSSSSSSRSKRKRRRRKSSSSSSSSRGAMGVMAVPVWIPRPKLDGGNDFTTGGGRTPMLDGLGAGFLSLAQAFSSSSGPQTSTGGSGDGRCYDYTKGECKRENCRFIHA
mmetsp:Transcript_51087/g.121377  ORF Transcript_51087/g.121377 Transcript_51087/m.121377 type:complete len:248 (-) Transcript_51087:13-756(-)